MGRHLPAEKRRLGVDVAAGVEERLDVRVPELPGGERQRAPVARAPAGRPPSPLVVASRDPRLEDIADRVLRLEGGRLEEPGPAAAAGGLARA